MYRVFCFLILWLSFLAPLSSEELLGNCQTFSDNEKLTNTLNLIQNKFESFNSFRADFEQISYSSALDISETSSGKLKLLKPDMMYWDYLLPEKQIVLIKDLTYELYQPKLSQILRSQLEEVLFSDFPLSFLLGKAKLLESFSVIDSCISSRSLKFVFIPKISHPNSQLREMVLVVSKNELIPTSISILDVNDNRNTVSFSNVDVVNSISKSEFRLPVNPESVDIVDSTIN